MEIMSANSLGGAMQDVQNDPNGSIIHKLENENLAEFLSLMPFPLSAEGLKMLVSQAAEHLSDLEAYLESQVSKAENGDWIAKDEEDNGVFYALFLLANAKHPATFTLALRMLRLGEEWLDAFFGDFVTEAFASILISTCAGRFDDLSSLILEPKAWLFSRVVAFDALVGLAYKQEDVRPRVAETLRSLYADLKSGQDDQVALLHMCVEGSTSLGMVDLIPELTLWYESFPALPGSGYASLDELVEDTHQPAYTDQIVGEFDFWKLSKTLRRYESPFERDLLLKASAEIKKLEKRRKKNKEARKKRKKGKK